MGMYTGLRFKAIIKKEYAEAIQKMMKDNLTWEEMKEQFSEFSPLTKMAGYDRAHSIPYGSVEHGYWEIEDETAEHGYRTPDEWIRGFNADSREWTFQCSSKSVRTIHYFLRHVAAKIVEKVIHIEDLYCENRCSSVYELVDGEIVENPEKKIDYGEDDFAGFWGEK